jgi:hypothetical protein
VNAATTDDLLHLAIAVDQDGDFAVTWTAYQPSGNQVAAEVYARRFRNEDGPKAHEFPVNVYTTGN